MIRKLNFKRIERRRDIEKSDDIEKEDGCAVVLSYVASTDAVDRYGDIVDQAGWNLDGYKSNPVVLFNHRQDSLPIAKARSIEVVDNQLEIEIEFDMADPDSARIGRKAEAGYLNAVSVGFQPVKFTPRADLPKEHKAYSETEGNFYHQSELLEVSLVTVPANSQATAAKVFDYAAFEGVLREKLDLNKTLNFLKKHILSVEETENGYLVEFERHADAADAEEIVEFEEESLQWLEEYMASEEKEVQAFADLPIAARDQESNPEDQEKDAISRAILGDDDWDRMAMAFAWVDTGKPEEFESYRLQIARLTNEETPEDAAPEDGDLLVYWDLIASAMQAVIGGESGIPDSDLEKTHSLLARYFEKFDEEPPPLKGYGDDSKDDDEEESEEEDEEKKLFNLALLRALTEFQGE